VKGEKEVAGEESRIPEREGRRCIPSRVTTIEKKSPASDKSRVWGGKKKRCADLAKGAEGKNRAQSSHKKKGEIHDDPRGAAFEASHVARSKEKENNSTPGGGGGDRPGTQEREKEKERPPLIECKNVSQLLGNLHRRE